MIQTPSESLQFDVKKETVSSLNGSFFYNTAVLFIILHAILRTAPFFMIELFLFRVRVIASVMSRCRG